MGRVILNCDLGEDEPDVVTRELLALVDAANIGCGTHAGSAEKTRATMALAAEAGCRIGAHPGLSANGGRGHIEISPAGFAELLHEQVGRFREFADHFGERVTYIKLHGSLYHEVEVNDEIAAAYLGFLLSEKTLAVVTRSGGAFARRAQASGITVWEEVFADRGYRTDGSLVPRSEPGSILTENAAIGRLRHWLQTGQMRGCDQAEIPLRADTLCVHGDSPEALAMAARIRELLDDVR